MVLEGALHRKDVEAAHLPWLVTSFQRVPKEMAHDVGSAPNLLRTLCRCAVPGCSRGLRLGLRPLAIAGAGTTPGSNSGARWPRKLHDSVLLAGNGGAG